MVLGIAGSGGFGREILETVNAINRKSNRYEEIVFIEIFDEELEIQGVKTITIERAKEKYRDELGMIVGIGEPKIRHRVIEQAKELGVRLVSVIHPSVEIPDTTTIGAGTYIGPGAFISCNVNIGENVAVHPSVNVGHDTVIGNNVVMCGNTSLGGNCHIADDAFLGMNVSVKQGCKIGTGAVVGMGSAVYGDVEEYTTAIGIPARVMKKRNESDKVFS